MRLFEECIQVLRPQGLRVLSDTEAAAWLTWFETNVPITSWGRIDWEHVPIIRLCTISSLKDEFIRMGLDYENAGIKVLWDDGSLPCLETGLSNVAAHFDDVSAVSFNTWLISTDHRFVVEYYHEDSPDQVRVAVVSGKSA